jgi:hypothetical protein
LIMYYSLKKIIHNNETIIIKENGGESEQASRSPHQMEISYKKNKNK